MLGPSLNVRWLPGASQPGGSLQAFFYSWSIEIVKPFLSTRQRSTPFHYTPPLITNTSDLFSYLVKINSVFTYQSLSRYLRHVNEFYMSFAWVKWVWNTIGNSSLWVIAWHRSTSTEYSITLLFIPCLTNWNFIHFYFFYNRKPLHVFFIFQNFKAWSFNSACVCTKSCVPRKKKIRFFFQLSISIMINDERYYSYNT